MATTEDARASPIRWKPTFVDATVGDGMPNHPRPDNPHRSVRVEDDLWDEAGPLTAAWGTSRGEVMRNALAVWVEEHREAAPVGAP